MNQIKIDLIDNGFILSYVKPSSLGRPSELVVRFFSEISEVCEVINHEFK